MMDARRVPAVPVSVCVARQGRHDGAREGLQYLKMVGGARGALVIGELKVMDLETRAQMQCSRWGQCTSLEKTLAATTPASPADPCRVLPPPAWVGSCAQTLDPYSCSPAYLQHLLIVPEQAHRRAGVRVHGQVAGHHDTVARCARFAQLAAHPRQLGVRQPAAKLHEAPLRALQTVGAVLLLVRIGEVGEAGWNGL